MARWMRSMLRGVWGTAFATTSVVVAGYAFSYLYAEVRDDPFAVQFAVSGVDVPLHFFIAGLALLVAPVQLVGALRRRWPAFHRQLGWLYGCSVLVGSMSGLSLAMNAQGGLPGRTAFVLLALMWPVATAIGIRYAIAKDLVRHRQWMLRSVALTYSAVTLRLVLLIGFGVLELPFMAVYVASAWLGWSINLAVCELWLRWPAWRARRVALRSM